MEVLQSGRYDCSYNLWAREHRKYHQTLIAEESHEQDVAENEIYTQLSEVDEQMQQLRIQN